MSYQCIAYIGKCKIVVQGLSRRYYHVWTKTSKGYIEALCIGNIGEPGQMYKSDLGIDLKRITRYNLGIVMVGHFWKLLWL